MAVSHAACAAKLRRQAVFKVHRSGMKFDPKPVPPGLCLGAEMPKPVPSDPAEIALRSLIWRVVVFFLAGLAVIATFVIAWRFGAFAPSRP